LNPILLEKSDSNILANKRSNSNRTPDEIKRELDKALKVEKQSGIPIEKAVLALLHLGIVGKKRISRIEDVTDQGLAVFAGLSKMPDPSFFHEFLDKPGYRHCWSL
jgi:hypothetical protein